MTFSHKKRVYRATCCQWTGHNLPAITDLLHKIGYSEVEVFRDSVMARGAGRGLLCVHLGSWLRIGEDGRFKVMSSEEFDLKYEEV